MRAARAARAVRVATVGLEETAAEMVVAKAQVEAMNYFVLYFDHHLI